MSPARPFNRTPGLGLINLAIFAAFMAVAGVGTLVPALVKDRLPEQFEPLWNAVVGRGDDGWSRLAEPLALASQWAIGLTELAIGALASAAVFSQAQRNGLAKASLGLATALFGLFMVVLFFLHEKDLPKWNQYPAILVWIAATWVLLEREAGPKP